MHLFFRGHYLSFTEYDSTGVLLLLLQAFSLQFLLAWILITGILFLLLKGLKSSVIWKPMFIAIGFALLVMVIRAIINLIATLALPAVYYPFDLSGGVGFTPYGTLAYPPQFIGMAFADTQAAFSNAEAVNRNFQGDKHWNTRIGIRLAGCIMRNNLGNTKTRIFADEKTCPLCNRSWHNNRGLDFPSRWHRLIPSVCPPIFFISFLVSKIYMIAGHFCN